MLIHTLWQVPLPFHSLEVSQRHLALYRKAERCYLAFAHFCWKSRDHWSCLWNEVVILCFIFDEICTPDTRGRLIDACRDLSVLLDDYFFWHHWSSSLRLVCRGIFLSLFREVDGRNVRFCASFVVTIRVITAIYLSVLCTLCFAIM